MQPYPGLAGPAALVAAGFFFLGQDLTTLVLMFEKELEFFIAHQDELVAKHPGQVLVIRGETIEGAYHSALDAYVEAQKRFPVGTFMIQQCEPGVSAYTVFISSNT